MKRSDEGMCADFYHQFHNVDAQGRLSRWRNKHPSTGQRRISFRRNAPLAIEAFALLRDKASVQQMSRNTCPSLTRVLAHSLMGGYDSRLEDNLNIRTPNGLVERARSSNLSFNVITPPQSKIAAPFSQVRLQTNQMSSFS
jgi:hypothetical protein